MKLHLWTVFGLICLIAAAGGARAECTLRDKQALYDAGKNLYEIDKICGESNFTEKKPDTDRNPESEPVRPKRPDTHGRLQESSNICQTDYLWCQLSQSGPPGTPCQCNTSYGPQFGSIVRK